MNGLQRYDVVRPDDGATLDPRGLGRLVLFADVEGALKDSKRLRWIMPILEGDDSESTNRRTQALGAGLMLGKSGSDLIDFAMEGCPE